MDRLRSSIQSFWKLIRTLTFVFCIYIVPFFSMLYYVDNSFSTAYNEIYQSVDRVKVKLVIMMK